MSGSDRIFKITALPQANIWGTDRLVQMVEGTQSLISGEAFLLAAMQHGDSPIDGIMFSTFYEQHREEYFGLTLQQFPLRVNLIDTSAALSIQVHPGPAITGLEGYPSGVREFWLVLETTPNAILAIGHHAPDLSVLESVINEGNLEPWLNYHHVTKGDYFDLEYGTVHAIGKGMMIYELTYNLDYTYRLYDYQRIDPLTNEPRQLHIRQALAAIREPQVYRCGHYAGDMDSTLLDDDGFAKLMVWQINQTKTLTTQEFYIMTVVEGCGEINHQPVKAFQTYFVPRDRLLTISGTLTILVVTYHE